MWLLKLIPLKTLSSQLRKPSGFIGRFVMTKIFTVGNADLNNFAKDCLDLKQDDRVLEIGFGPGKLINQIAQIVTEGKVEGIDFSETMITQAKKLNESYIASNRVTLHKGDSEILPFSDNTFDKICSANTIYFWKDPASNLKEIYRATKPGGKVVVGFRDSQQMENFNLDEDIFTTYSKEEVVRLLLEAGFSNATTKEKESPTLTSYCAIATK